MDKFEGKEHVQLKDDEMSEKIIEKHEVSNVYEPEFWNVSAFQRPFDGSSNTLRGLGGEDETGVWNFDEYTKEDLEEVDQQKFSGAKDVDWEQTQRVSVPSSKSEQHLPQDLGYKDEEYIDRVWEPLQTSEISCNLSSDIDAMALELDDQSVPENTKTRCRNPGSFFFTETENSIVHRNKKKRGEHKVQKVDDTKPPARCLNDHSSPLSTAGTARKIEYINEEAFVKALEKRQEVDMTAENMDPIEWAVRSTVPIPEKYYWDTVQESDMDKVPAGIKVWHNTIAGLWSAYSFTENWIGNPLVNSAGLTNHRHHYVTDCMTKEEWEQSKCTVQERIRKRKEWEKRLVENAHVANSDARIGTNLAFDQSVNNQVDELEVMALQLDDQSTSIPESSIVNFGLSELPLFSGTENPTGRRKDHGKECDVPILNDTTKVAFASLSGASSKKNHIAESPFNHKKDCEPKLASLPSNVGLQSDMNKKMIARAKGEDTPAALPIAPQEALPSALLLPNDVLFGKAKFSYSHPGNMRFRKIIQKFRGDYQSAKLRERKGQIIDTIIATVNARGGRFLRCHGADFTGGIWYPVSDKVARTKVCHGLRSGRPPSSDL